MTAEDLRERVTNALAPSGWLREDGLPATVDAVLAALAGDPGDLPARMAAELSRHYILTGAATFDGRICACGDWVGGETGPDWNEHLAAAAMSVRSEDTAALAAENTELRARLHEATGNALVYHERMASAQTDRDRYRAGMKSATERAELADVEVERLRAELADVKRAVYTAQITHARTAHPDRMHAPDCPVCDVLVPLSLDLPARPDDITEIRRLAQATTEETNDEH